MYNDENEDKRINYLNRDLDFRDRVIEFIGTSSTLIKSLDKEVISLVIAIKELRNDIEKKVCVVEEDLQIIKDGYLVTKTKIAAWGSIASILFIVVWELAKRYVFKI